MTSFVNVDKTFCPEKKKNPKNLSLSYEFKFIFLRLK